MPARAHRPIDVPAAGLGVEQAEGFVKEHGAVRRFSTQGAWSFLVAPDKGVCRI
ncbi:MAG: hypothetical protein Kow00120_11310 [Anaerolineae bacterium]